jgi:Domain of unknown function (DUF4157)
VTREGRVGKSGATERRSEEASSQPPGKATRALELDAAPQWEDIPASEYDQIARHGVARADATLPHRELIQQSFGRHDVGSIRVQIGGPAATAADALNARAYATHERIAFATSPDVHTAAHEAAHVIQQRRGRAPGGLGARDGYSEEHADRVADRVEAGASAEALLDGDDRESGDLDRASVQLKANDAKPKTQEHWDFVREHLTKILGAIEMRLSRLPDPHPRLRWIVDGGNSVWKRIKERAELKPEHSMLQLAKLVAPADLWSIVDRARRGPTGTKLDVLKMQVATAVEEGVFASLPRMGMRAVVQWDRTKSAPHSDDLVPSSPLDALLADILADAKVVKWQAHRKGNVDDTPADPFKNGTKQVAFEYAGAKDSNLWNWIKVTTPSATAEDVASTPLGPGRPALGTDQAYRLAISAPYFGIPIEAARQIPEMQRFMTVETLAAVRKEAAQDSRPIVDMADRKTLRDSKLADDAALAQAPPAHGQLDAARALGRARLQAEYIAAKIRPYRYVNVVEPALHFIERREREAADPKQLARWAATLEAQERTLHDTSSELREVIASIEKQGINPDAVSRQQPIRDLLIAYARAGGLSHLQAEGPAALVEARRLRGRLALAQAEFQLASARDGMVSIEEAQRVQQLPGEAEPHVDDTIVKLPGLEAKRQALRGKLARGQEVTADEIDDLQVDSAEADLRSRLGALSTSVHDLQKQANDADDVKGKRYGIYSVDAACAVILEKINGPEKPPIDQNDVRGGWHAQLDAAHKDLTAGPKAASPKQLRARRANAIRQVNQQLDAFRSKADLKGFFEGAQKEVTNAKVAKLLRHVAVQVGLAVLTGEAIGALGLAVRGIALAGEIGAEIRNASLAWEAGAVLAQAAANTAVNGAMGGPMDARTFVENGLAIVLTSAAMKPFQGLLKETAEAEGAIVSWGRTATKGGRLAAELVIDTGAGIGAAGLAHAVTHGGDVGAQDAESWVTMGLSIAASKYVGKRTHAMKERLFTAAQQLGAKTKPQFEALAKHAGEVERIAEELGGRDPKKGNKPPSAEEALGLMRKHHELVVAEHKILSKDHPNDARAGANRRDAIDGAQLVDATLQLAHLSPIVDGQIYEGTPKQIQDAFRAADSTGVSLKREWNAERGVWELQAGNRKLEIHETLTASKKPKPHESRHAAEEVPGSNFKGQNPGAAPVKLEQVMTAVDEAALILNFDAPKTYGPRYQRVGSTVTFSEGSKYMVVKFRVGEPSTGPAQHNYVDGANEVTVTVSREARPQDLRRALAHELAELNSYVVEPTRNREGALHETSKVSDQKLLAGHDVGRVAELRVLLHELAYATTRTAEVHTEINKLVEHLGFDPNTFGQDPRARNIFGQELMARAYEYKYAAKKRMPIEVNPAKDVTDNSAQITETTPAWRMDIEFVVDGRKQGVAYATAPLEHGRPTAGPEFYIDNTTVSGGLDQSITLVKGGTPLKLTEFVLNEATARFTKRFGHAPQTLNGHLAQDNKRIFQKAYAGEALRLRNAGKQVDPQAVGARVMKETPFFKARERDYDVTLKRLDPDRYEDFLYGDPPELVRVPSDIDIDAVRKK